MRILVTTIIATSALFAASSVTAVPSITTDDLRAHVEYLADPAREGRGLGSAGIDDAADYIANRFREYGLQPGAEGGSFFQPFDANLKSGAVAARNVVAMLPGKSKDPDNYIVLGAHYDHLGYGGRGVTTPEDGEIHPGADDNASGVAGILELAEYFGHTGLLDRTLVFIAFSGEESGLLGSAHYVDHPTFPLEYALAMLNLDAVGRPDNEEVTVFGTESAAEFDSLLHLANTKELNVQTEADAVGPSDHASFVLKDIPSLHFFGTAHTDYHQPSDTADKLNYDAFEDLIEYLADFVDVLDDGPRALTFKEPAPSSHGRPHATERPWLGIVPDFGASTEGMAIRAVRPKSPAEAAGLRAGDVIVKLGDVDVTDIDGLMTALMAHSPGDKVTIEAIRDSERIKVEAKLGGRTR
jgi:hypothetical protein